MYESRVLLTSFYSFDHFLLLFGACYHDEMRLRMTTSTVSFRTSPVTFCRCHAVVASAKINHTVLPHTVADFGFLAGERGGGFEEPLV